jgi:hypothetical protein
MHSNLSKHSSLIHSYIDVCIQIFLFLNIHIYIYIYIYTAKRAIDQGTMAKRAIVYINFNYSIFVFIFIFIYTQPRGLLIRVPVWPQWLRMLKLERYDFIIQIFICTNVYSRILIFYRYVIIQINDVNTTVLSYISICRYLHMYIYIFFAVPLLFEISYAGVWSTRRTKLQNTEIRSENDGKLDTW